MDNAIVQRPVRPISDLHSHSTNARLAQITNLFVSAKPPNYLLVRTCTLPINQSLRRSSFKAFRAGAESRRLLFAKRDVALYCVNYSNVQYCGFETDGIMATSRWQHYRLLLPWCSSCLLEQGSQYTGNGEHSSTRSLLPTQWMQSRREGVR